MIVPAEGDFRLDREADTARLGAAIARELKRRGGLPLRPAGGRQVDAWRGR